MQDNIDQTIDQAVDEVPRILRRNLFQKAMMTTASFGALGLFASPAQAAANGESHQTLYFNNSPGAGAIQVPGTGDVKVLNFALALEDLEASLYNQAIARLTTGGVSGTGTTIPGLNITSGDDVTYLQIFSQVENDHAAFLRNAITAAGATPIRKFVYDFNLESMTRLQVVSLVYAAELTGVTAYTGAIPFFSSTKSPYVPVAAGILGTEARHTAVLAVILDYVFGVRPLVTTAPLYSENNGRDIPLTPDQVLNTGGTTAPSVTVAQNGQLSPVSGPAGFFYLPATT